MDTTPEDLLRKQLVIVEACLAAVERRDEVVAAIGGAADAVAARAALRRLLDVDELGATAICDLQLLMLSERSRQQLSHRRDELLAQLRDR